ncbi:hypothetical protein PoB_003365700 [Plakobranchus ocellatus]|uniref:Uncharacterized protein n=1 Tax=Plakobranchus ocellatus TaxID=259542 RepID=A0AAV4AJT1_9GAST|nr:hypothetical protein PoB_003365700 [Plakobranchus ocellatus]
MFITFQEDPKKKVQGSGKIIITDTFFRFNLWDIMYMKRAVLFGVAKLTTSETPATLRATENQVVRIPHTIACFRTSKLFRHTELDIGAGEPEEGQNNGGNRRNRNP